MPLPEFDLTKSNGALSEGVYQTLQSAIIKGGLKPGERLTEEAVAKHAEISRTPVREALRRLQDEGLLQTEGRSTVVAVPSLDELNDLYTVRETLEGLAARLAASFRNEKELLMLEKLLETMRQATSDGDVSKIVNANAGIHETIWQASRNRYLMQQVGNLKNLIDRLQASTLRLPERRVEALQEHEQIHKAIVAKDADSAEMLVRQHFRNAEATRLMLLRMRVTDVDIGGAD